jgi:hypothetical protein
MPLKIALMNCAESYSIARVFKIAPTTKKGDRRDSLFKKMSLNSMKPASESALAFEG